MIKNIQIDYSKVKMAFVLKREAKEQLKEFTNDKMEVLGDKFKSIIHVHHYDKWTDDDWVLFCCYSLSQLATRFAQTQKYNGEMSHRVVFIKAFSDSTVSFLINWMNRNDVYKDHNFKDRKNSFFRLINKSLKKNIKQSEILKKMQESLNHNTISNKQIDEFQELYGKQIYSYLGSQEILEDISIRNKSKASRYYYILHLSEIRYYAQEKRLSAFPFYEKSSIQDSFSRIINTLCGNNSIFKEKLVRQDSAITCQSQQKFSIHETDDLYSGDHQKSYFFCSKAQEEDNLFSVLDLGFYLHPGYQQTQVEKSITFLPNI